MSTETSESDMEKYETNIRRNEKEKVNVVVLGDLGHSPRMGYHALSLAEEGFEVNFIGFRGSTVQEEISQNQNITLTYMKPCPSWIFNMPKVLQLFLKVFFQSFILFFTLLSGSTPSKLLVQNPPAIPALPVCWFYCLIKGTKFFIDWHNYGYTIMALSLSLNNPIVKIYKFLEYLFGSLASGGFCVTKRMQQDLSSKYKIKNIVVHYDRPHKRFHSITDEEKHDFFLKMSNEYPCFSSSLPDKSVFTERFADGRVCIIEDRPALLVSSTSWTEDEDFSILLYALEEYENIRKESPTCYPQLVVAITGKGPLKEKYINDIQSREWQHVVVITPWLTAEDYPKLLAASDLGISLHFSSSSLDLPMKVVDMFGSGIPVMAIKYLSLHELVQDKVNGFVFESKEELADLLQNWFWKFPIETQNKEAFYDLYKNINEFRQLTWHSSWTCNVLPFFKSVNCKDE